MTSRKRGASLALEGLVIVLSILLAFALDAWWEGQQLERDVYQELGNVGRELRRNQELLVFQIDVIQRIVAAEEFLLGLMQADPSAGDIAVADTVGFLATTSVTFDPSLGALDALIASGRLSAVADTDLRLRLSGLRALVADATELQERIRGLYFDQMLPQISDDSALDFDRMTDVSTRFWGSERRVGTQLQSAGSVQFPNTQRLRALARLRQDLESITLAEMVELEREFDAIARQLERGR